MLGEAYANGYGVPEDDAEAVKWFRKAAAQGHEKALAQLESAERLASITPIERVLLKGEKVRAAQQDDDLVEALRKRSAQLRMIDRTKCQMISVLPGWRTARLRTHSTGSLRRRNPHPRGRQLLKVISVDYKEVPAATCLVTGKNFGA